MSPTVQTLIRNPEPSLIMNQSTGDPVVPNGASPLVVQPKQFATPNRLMPKNTVTPPDKDGGSEPDKGEPPKKEEQPERATHPAPSINLGPRLTKNSPPRPSPARAVSLMPRKSPSDASKENIEGEATSGNSAVKRNLGSAMKKGEIKTESVPSAGFATTATAISGSAKTPQETPTIPPPSQFLAAKISPLRSSARIKKRDSPRPASVDPPSRSPLPDIGKADLLSPCGMFLTPRTPRGAAPLTPSNFACDFGKGTGEGVDASGVFAWLHSPTLLSANGLFSPNGGLAQSLTNTPRGMYGFSGKTPYTPSASAVHSSFFFSDAEGLPDRDDKNNSMICISPLASQKKPAAIRTPNPADPVLSTPMSIDFSKVFATPRLPTPRLSKTGSAAKSKEIQTPVLSSMERSLMEDEDLNAMLQLAEATPSGAGRSLGLLSPLLTSSLRRMEQKREPDEALSGLQLPIISGRSIGSGSRFSPQLAVRSSSNGSSMDASKKKSSKKRKAGDGPDSQHKFSPQRLSYPQPPHPSMLHYRHQGAPPMHGAGYYPHPGHTTIPPRHPHHHAAYPPPHPQHHCSHEPGPKRQAAKKAKAVIKKAVADDGSYTPSPPKKVRKSPTKARKPKSKNAMPEDPVERERVASAIRAVNASSGGNNDKAAELAAAIMRGVTMRPSGKWQAQLYYSGKSRYIGVFDSREKAALAYEIAREVLKEEKGAGPLSQEIIDKNVNLARKAAFAGVNGTPTS